MPTGAQKSAGKKGVRLHAQAANHNLKQLLAEPPPSICNYLKQGKSSGCAIFAHTNKHY